MTSVTAICPRCRTEFETDESSEICVNCEEWFKVTEGNYKL